MIIWGELLCYIWIGNGLTDSDLKLVLRQSSRKTRNDDTLNYFCNVLPLNFIMTSFRQWTMWNPDFFPLRNMSFEPWHHLGECISNNCHEVNCYDILCEEFKPDFAWIMETIEVINSLLFCIKFSYFFGKRIMITVGLLLCLDNLKTGSSKFHKSWKKYY